MVQTINQRIAAQIEGDFVVFLIGARLNRWWKFPEFIRVGRAMDRMVTELQQHPELGLLHVERTGTLLIQYWRSFEQLHAYARDRDAEHLPAWADFNRRLGSNGDIGIWHETYLVPAGQYEAIYNNMPAFGLAMAGSWVPASGQNKTSKGRLRQSDGADEPAYDDQTV
ncbi:MAG: DUF4188 domain-containing protein [Proteobacteria bacterium]|nr:DUF4188 domain-containing protein [Pseudomonadota bacterium]